ncbi:hypothetical protein MferCBS31731_000283 [Microsporum ferrugineum]
MAHLVQCEAASRDLLAAIESLTAYYGNEMVDGLGDRLAPVEESAEARRARESALANLAKLQWLLAEPKDLLRNLVYHTQLLACIKWLGDFQVPACIPLGGMASMKDISNLISVPECQLCRVIRMAVTGGFLQEPQPSYVSHSELSAAFVRNPSYLDAAMFLAETAAPAALNMATDITQHDGSADREDSDVAWYSVFTTVSEADLPRLQRQWHAYLRYGMGDYCDTATEVLTCLEEPSIPSESIIVEVGAKSIERAVALANQYPSFHFIVQLRSSRNDRPRSPNPQVTVSHRQLGFPQPILNASVYILNFPIPSPGSPPVSLAGQITAELRAHLPALRLNRSATLVLISPLFSGSEEGVTLARIHDLSLSQLASQGQLDMSGIINLLTEVGDGDGRLALVNQVGPGGRCKVVALEVKYQPHST